MNTYRLRHHGHALKLPEKPFASGGEGNLYRVQLAMLPGIWVAKIYHPPKRTAEREAKINYLLSHRPAALTDDDDKDWTWVKDVLYDKAGHFVGLLLPFVEGEKLEILCSQKLPRSLSAVWRRMDLRQEGVLDYRIKVGFNLAVAIYRLHSSTHYVLVDMKPDNVLIQPNGLLSIVDLDSMAIHEGDRALFPAPVATPEYTPPEYYYSPLAEGQALDPAWDRFGLAVILYKLFCGVHPFAGTAKAPYDSYVSLHQKIQHGLFVHSPSRQRYLKVIPPPHQRFKTLPEAVQALFIQCFEDGHDDPSQRPTAEEWCVALLYAIGEPQLMKRYQALLGGGWYQPISKMPLPSELKEQQAPLPFDRTQWMATQVNQWMPSLPVIPDKALQTMQAIIPEIQKADRRFYIFWWLGGLLLMWVILESGLKYMPRWVTYSSSLALILFWMMVVPRLLNKLSSRFTKKQSTKALYQQLQTLDGYSQQVRQTFQGHLQRALSRVDSKYQHSGGLPDLPEQWTSYEQQSVAIRAERAAAFEQVRQRYLAEGLQLPLFEGAEAHQLYDLWLLVQRQIRQEETRLRQANKTPLKEQQLQQETATAIKEAKQELDDQLKAWHDEARFLFDLDGLFEDEADGLLQDAQNLRRALARKGIDRFTDLLEVHWRDRQHLVLKKGERPFELGIARYPQLENFYQLYRDYEPAIDFSQKRHIKDGKDYLQQRYEMGKKEYESKVAALQTAYEAQKAKLEQQSKAALVQSTLPKLRQAEAQLSALRDAQQQELKALETHYQQLYMPIRAAVEQALKARYREQVEQREAYRIAIDDLLSDTEVAQEQLSFNKAIRQFEQQYASWEKQQKG